MEMDYKKSKKINPSICTAWLIHYLGIKIGDKILKPETKVIQLWAKDAEIEEVIEFAIAHAGKYGPKFEVQNIDVGSAAILGEIHSLYSTDGRKVNQRYKLKVK